MNEMNEMNEVGKMEIGDLPVEVLEHIFSFLSSPADQVLSSLMS